MLYNVFTSRIYVWISHFFQHYFLKKLIVLHQMVLAPIWITTSLSIQGVISGLPFLSIDLYVFPYASATLFWLGYLCNNFWNWEVWVLQLFVLSQGCLANWVCCNSIWILYKLFYFCDKGYYYIARYCIWFMGCFEDYYHLITNRSSNS